MTAARSLTTLREDAARDPGWARAREPFCPAHARDDRGRSRRRPLLVLAQDDGDVRRAGQERERAVADGDQDVVHVLGGADVLLRLVEDAQAAHVALDRRLRGAELVDLAHRQDAGVAVGGGLADRHGEAHDAVAPAQLDDVARLERDLAAVRVVQRDAPLGAHHGGAVGRAQVAQHVLCAAEGDAGVLARDQLVAQDDVVAGRAA